MAVNYPSDQQGFTLHIFVPILLPFFHITKRGRLHVPTTVLPLYKSRKERATKERTTGFLKLYPPPDNLSYDPRYRDNLRYDSQRFNASTIQLRS